MKRATVSKKVTVMGRPFIGFPWQTVNLTISPSDEGGLIWKIPDKHIKLTPSIMGGTSELGDNKVKRISHQTIRYHPNALPEDGCELRVPEHLLSALFLADVTDAVIEIDKPITSWITRPLLWGNVISYSPPIGDGSALTFYKELNPSGLPGEVPEWHVNKSLEVPTDYGSLRVDPSDKLEVVVEQWRNDPYGINAEGFSHRDVYGINDPSLLGARGLLGFYPNAFLHKILSPLQWMFSGVTSETYIPRYSPEKMRKPFLSRRNEHLVHLTFSDFPAELLSTFGSKVYGKFTLQKTGGSHKGRMTALNTLKNEGIIVKV